MDDGFDRLNTTIVCLSGISALLAVVNWWKKCAKGCWSLWWKRDGRGNLFKFMDPYFQFLFCMLPESFKLWIDSQRLRRRRMSRRYCFVLLYLLFSFPMILLMFRDSWGSINCRRISWFCIRNQIHFAYLNNNRRLFIWITKNWIHRVYRTSTVTKANIF